MCTRWQEVSHIRTVAVNTCVTVEIAFFNHLHCGFTLNDVCLMARLVEPPPVVTSSTHHKHAATSRGKSKEGRPGTPVTSSLGTSRSNASSNIEIVHMCEDPGGKRAPSSPTTSDSSIPTPQITVYLLPVKSLVFSARERKKVQFYCVIKDSTSRSTSPMTTSSSELLLGSGDQQP
ncbi:unnamed protein product, partial [Amoebophrya sp. A25]|eukprot:GSA25T00023842001.1